jgi:hypothetical protein
MSTEKSMFEFQFMRMFETCHTSTLLLSLSLYFVYVTISDGDNVTANIGPNVV